MKIMKTLMAVSILAAASQSHATLYDVTGSLAGANTVGATSDPGLYAHAGSTAFDTTGVQWPTFSGQWDINTASPSVTGTFSDFVQYSTSVFVASIAGRAAINQPHLVYSFNGGTATYNAATRTFTLGQAMAYTGQTDAQLGTAGKNATNAQTSDASLLFDYAKGGVNGVCTGLNGGGNTICSGQTSIFLANPNLERFYMTLTFSSDFTSFTGTAVGADIGGPLPIGVTGNTWYTWNFSGTQAPVPVPAAAWLMGSGLVGLAGVARRRRAQA